MEWYIKCLKNYADFSGRARRKEYWMFTLFNFIIIIGLFLISAFVTSFSDDHLFAFGLIILYAFFIIVPSLAATARRLHDTNRSGLYYFVSFIPFIGRIWLLVLLIEDSYRGPNKWGENPKEISNEQAIDQIGTE